VADIVVADSSWVGCDTGKTFVATGLRGICDREEVELIDLKKDKFEDVRIPEGDELGGTVKIARTVLEADKLINLPKLKAHAQTKLTLSLKNLKGCIHDSEKQRFHRIDIERAIAELGSVLKPDLIVMDAIICEMTAELGCDPVRMDSVLAGTDPVAMDALCATVMGYEPDEIEHIAHAEKLGVGTGLDVSGIELHGDMELSELKGAVTEPVGFQRYTDSFQSAGVNIIEDGACSSCLGALCLALKRVIDEGQLSELEGCDILIGQHYDDSGKEKPEGSGGTCIGIGKCTKELKGLDIFVNGCPPTALKIYKKLKE
jgi:uncharacterized protein (DUF362 family)